MISDAFNLLLKYGSPAVLAELLDESSFDELVEIDYRKNTCVNLYHTEDKYHVAVLASTYVDLYHYCVEYMVHPEDKQIYKELMDPETIGERLRNSERPGLLFAEFRYKLIGGDWCWVRQVVIGGETFGLDEGIVHFYVFDIQNKKNREFGGGVQKLKKASRHNLTALYGTADFFEKARSFVGGADGDWCFVVIDIEHFNLYNDWYGRDKGDILLGEIGHLLAGVESKSKGLAGYLGQDDFVIVMPYDLDEIRAVYYGIHRLVVEKGNTVGFLPAFGVCPIDGTSAVMDVYDKAALAMKHAKGDYHNRVVLFHPKMYEETDHEYKVLYEFQNALHNGRISFYLQPQCRASSGKIVGAESLARWFTPDGGTVDPDDFVPILEKYGFISDLDKVIWDGVFRWIRHWLDEGHNPPPISVNVSQIDILTMDVAKHFEGLLERYSVPPEYVKVEITESSYAESNEIVRDLTQRLQDMGLLVLMDDFGSGYSSLNMLNTIKMDIIKLDARFLNLGEKGEHSGTRIIESVINMAKNLSLPIIVEGVETRKQLEFLTGLGCRYMQGYYFYHPMQVSDFEDLIRNESILDLRGFLAKPNEQFRIREFLDENVYTDSMLNSVIGPVAIYRQDGKRVDIVRFNEQFYEATNVPDFMSRIDDIQRFIPHYEHETFYAMLDEACDDRLNGSTKMIHFKKPDGGYVYFLMHMYCIGEEEGERKFYGSVRDITKLSLLETDIRILSRSADETVILLYKSQSGLRPHVVLNGLEKKIGLDKDQMQAELNSNSFFDRVDPGDRSALLDYISKTKPEDQHVTMSYRVRGADGGLLNTVIEVEHVDDDDSQVDAILRFREVDKGSK